MASGAAVMASGQSAQSVGHPSKLMPQGWSTPEQTHEHVLHQRAKSPKTSTDVSSSARAIETSPTSIYDSLQMKPMNVELPPSLVEVAEPTFMPSHASLRAAMPSSLPDLVPAPTPADGSKLGVRRGELQIHSLFLSAAPLATFICMVYLCYMWENVVFVLMQSVGPPTA